MFLALYYFANEFIKTNKKLFLAGVFLAISNVLNLYFCIDKFDFLIQFFINFILEIILFLYFYKFQKVYKNKLVFYKFSRNDYFIFSVMVLLLSLGVFSFEFIEKYISLFVVIFVIILLGKILPIDRFFIGVTVLLVGTVVATSDFFLFQIGMIFVCFVALFKDFNKWIFLGFVSTILLILLIIFKTLDILSIILAFFAVFIYIFVPNKIFVKISDCFEADGSSIILQTAQNQMICELKSKLIIMSQTLLDMQKSFKFLLIGKIDRQKACTELAGDVIQKCCNECENFRFCFMENINKRDMFENLLIKAIENKQISASDLSNGVQAYCNKSAIVINEVNQMARLFLTYEKEMKNQDESKLLISSEIGNFAGIFKNFANNIKNSVKINTKLSKNLKDSLINSLLDIKEVLIFENENGVESVRVIASNEQILKKELAFNISKNIKNHVILKNIQHLEQSGVSIATFIPKTKINVQFAVSTKAKEQKNGDNTVISKIADNKFFVAIADGMGHGEQAYRMSSMVLNLIKHMFEVGIDGTLAVETVNKLLIPAGVDNFSTLDACVIDLDKNECVFIKLGASVSVLKHDKRSEIIASDSLPIGVVSSIKPTVVKRQIFGGDMIFLSSDGVVDSFSSVQSFGTFINDSKIYNMQKFLDNVIFDAESLNQRHIDDMTIIGINLLKN